MSIDPKTETLRTLAEIAATYPWPDSKRPTVSQIFRWTTGGSRGSCSRRSTFRAAVNEHDMFLKRFLESAKYAGLLEGEPDPKAQTIRLRPAVAASSNGESVADATAKASENQWVIVAPNDIGSLLDGFGLTGYQERCDVSQRAAGEIAINIAN